jgi:hypothetical protein
MRFRLVAIVLIVGVVIGTGLVGARSNRQASNPPDHVAWVTDVLKRMQTIKVAMTRTELLSVFTTEGGLSTPLRRTFVSRDCPYFKVDVEFEAVGRPSRDSDGRVTMVEGNQDRIVKISRPYLQFGVVD